VAKTPLSAGSIRRPGRSRVRPVASRPQFLIDRAYRLETPVTRSKQRKVAVSNRRWIADLQFALSRQHLHTWETKPLASGATSTFDGYVYGNNRNMICGTLQAQPVSNVLGTRPN
jgi:hypothetical protein